NHPITQSPNSPSLFYRLQRSRLGAAVTGQRGCSLLIAGLLEYFSILLTQVPHESAAFLFGKHQLARYRVKVDDDQIARSELVGRHQVGQRIHEEPFYCPLQMTSPVLVVYAFIQQEFLCIV